MDPPRRRDDARPVERADAALLARHRLRIPPGQQPLLPDRHRAGEHGPGADAGQRLAPRDPVRQGPGPGAGALARPAPERRRGASANRHRDRVAGQRVRAVHRGDAERPRVRRRSRRRRRRDSSPRWRRAARTWPSPSTPARSLAGPPSPPLQFAQRIRERFVGFDTIDAMPILEDLRTVKTPYERKVLVKSLEISSEAQMAGMRAARPGAYEYEVKAAIEAVHRGRGAVSWSYPSIVGSGPNATILHYPDGDRQMQAGDLLLVDAACNYALHVGRHHADLSGQRHVLAAAEGPLPDRAAGAGGGHQGGPARVRRCRMSTRRPSR